MADSVPRTAAEADFTLQLGEFTTQDVRVLGFSGNEGLSELYSFRVDVRCERNDFTETQVLGKPCLLEIATASGSRWLHGMVNRLEVLAASDWRSYYAIHVVPVHWLLTRRIRSRIFQAHMCSDMTVPGIVQKVFQDAGIPQDNYRLVLHETYPAREYVVQYRESEWDFVSRLLEEEGIHYFFEHTTEGHKLVLADSGSAHVASALCASCEYRPTSGLNAADQVFVDVREAAEIQIGAASLKDFDFTRPKLDLSARSTGPAYTALEFSDYPARYTDRDTGTRLAGVRLQEQQCRKNVLHMAGNVRGLIPGQTFQLTLHPLERLNNVDYLVTRLTQRGTQPQSDEELAAGANPSHEIELQCIPASVSFRPPRVTPRPLVTGSQTAIVVGPSGEEIHTDSYGRVKVQFHWDAEGQYDENSSCWVRVSQGAAGGQYGMMFLPRVGQEVIVDFLEGDPDRPIITGRVYNQEQMPPYALPDNRTRSVIKTNSSVGGEGTNEIMFEDLKDSEKILIFAQKDFHLRVTNDFVQNSDHDHHLTVEQHAFEKVKQKKHSEIVLDLNEKIGGNHSHEITGDLGQKVGGNHSLDASSNIYLKAGSNLILEAGSGLTLKVGGNFVKIDSSGVTIQGSITKINSGGAPGSGSAVSLAAPEAPIEADEATPGADTTFSPVTATMEALAPESAAFTPPEVTREETVTSWVEIEMVDESGQPWAGEYYEITRPDGKVIKGHLDENGFARVFLPQNEETQVSFPKLDARAWERG